MKTKTRKKIVADRPQFTVDNIPVYMDLPSIMRGLQHDEVIGIDLETTGLSAFKSNIALIQLYGEQSGTAGLLQIANGVVPKELHDLFTENKKFIVHNGVGFDLWFMATHGIPWRRATWYDTLVGEMVLASTGRRDVRKNLASSLQRRLGKTVDKTIEHGNWGAEVLSERQVEYAIQDVVSLPALYRAHLQKAEETKEMDALEMEQELMPYVAQMSINGLPLRRDFLEKFVQEQKDSIQEAEAFLRKEFWPDINLGSWQQLLKGLHQCGIMVEKTGVDYLIPASQVLVGTHKGKIVDSVLAWKHGAQRIKMYSPEWMDQYIINDWAHPHFWQAGADTTRFTSSDPNFQQIPKDSRYVIGNTPGYKIVSADYSQIEVRIAAFYAQDQRLLDALEHEDVHSAIAAETFGIPLNKVTKDQRRFAKNMTFLLLFGGGAALFYKQVKLGGGSITEKQAEDMVNRFFARFKGLDGMKKKAEQIANKEGPAIIRLPNSNRRILIGPSKRTTVILNTLVQGTAAVGIKHGLIEAGKRGLVDAGIGSQVHDEIVAAVPPRQAKEFAKELEECMIVGMKNVVDITIKVEAAIGDNWQK